MNPNADESFSDWDRSQKRLAALELHLGELRGLGGEQAPGAPALAAEVALLKDATQLLYEVALAAHRKGVATGQTRRNRPLSRARRLG